MQRRNFLSLIGMLPLLSGCIAGLVGAANAAIAAATKSKQRVRPSDPSWPSGPDWDALNHEVGGRLIRPQSPFANCDPGAACGEALKHLKNPYFLGDEVALTQTSGWVDAWTSEPSPYAVAAETTADVVAAVNFARTHDLRLVVKGGGHSYQGGSCAPDSLLVWMRQSDYFERSWQSSFWGKNYSKLAAVKRKYDPTGLFFVRHGVGSEDWSADGFTRVG